MTDIVDRLRHIADLWEPDEKSSIQLEAAAEIERLRAALAAVVHGATRYDEDPDSAVARAAFDEGLAAAIRALRFPASQSSPQDVPGYTLDKATMTYRKEGG